MARSAACTILQDYQMLLSMEVEEVDLMGTDVPFVRFHDFTLQTFALN